MESNTDIEIFIHCPATISVLDENGAVLTEGPVTAQLDSAGLSILPEFGEPFFSTYRNILEFTGTDYRIRLTLTSNEGITLSDLGYKYEDFLRLLSKSRNEMLLDDMLMKESLKSAWQDAAFSFRSKEGREMFKGIAEIRIYDTALVVMPEFSELLRIHFSDMQEVKPGDYLLTITTEDGEALDLSQLGRNFDPFRTALSEAINRLTAKTVDILSELLPDLDPLLLRKAARLLKEGRAARKSDLDAASPELWGRLEKRLDAFDIKEEYAFLKSLSQQEKLCIGIKRGLMGDLTGEYLWFLIPVYSTDTEKPGNAVAMEAASEDGEGKATYFFRIMPRQEYRKAKDINTLHDACDIFIKTINRCMLDINFRREPVYLTDERLLEPAYVKYLFAVQKLPSLKYLREHFIGRVIHTSQEQWKEDVTALLQFNIKADYDNQKWKKGD